VKPHRILALAAAAVLLVAAVASAAPADANATATISTGISCTKYIFTMTGGDLEFGLWSSPVADAWVTLNPVDGSEVGYGTAGLGYAMGPAAFSVTGTPNANFAITLPASAVTITNGVDTMTVDTWTTDAVGQQTLSASGTALFQVGGTLHIPAFAPLGAYAGSFTVSVDYN